MSNVNIILLVSPLVVLWVLCVLAISSYSSGWAKLAKAYRIRERFYGEKWSGQSGTLGLFSRYSLVVGASEKGLYLAVAFFCRPFHPPLLIPWSHVSSKPSRGLFFQRCELRFRSAPSITLSISQSLASDIAEAGGKDLTGVRKKARRGRDYNL
jgi:hypothetical protein